MPFDGNGTFNPPAPEYPAVGGTVIYADDRNVIDEDFADGLSNCLTRDGQSPALADIPLGGFKLTGLGLATASGDAISKNYLDTSVTLQAPGTANGSAASTAFVAATAFSTALPAQTGNSGKVVTTNGTSASWIAYGVAARQIFTATGTYTPTAGMRHCFVEMVGGGAGGITAAAGNNGGAGGGAGEYASGFFTAADIGASKAVTVGAGGAVDTDGGTSSLGTLLTAVGGSKGTGVYIGGVGGTGGTGTGVHSQGGDGGMGPGAFAGPQLFGGQGGASFFGGGGRQGYGGGGAATAGRAYGSGGGGNGFLATWSAAGAGKIGIVIITEFF